MRYSQTTQRLSGTIEPDDVTLLLTSPTGVVAFLINGMTIHSALLLGRGKYGRFQPRGRDKLNSLRAKLTKLALLIIDEVSMVGSNMLLEIHKILQQIMSLTINICIQSIDMESLCGIIR